MTNIFFQNHQNWKTVQCNAKKGSPIRLRNKFNDPRKNQLNGWGPLWFSLGGKTKDWPLVHYHKINEVKYLQSILFSTNAVKLLGQKRRNPKIDIWMPNHVHMYHCRMDADDMDWKNVCCINYRCKDGYLRKKICDEKFTAKMFFYTICTYVVKRSNDARTRRRA